MKLLVLGLLIALAVVFAATWDAVAAAIDNVVGIRTRADIEAVKRLSSSGATLGERLGDDAVWTARHGDALWRTLVKCRVVSEGTLRSYYWEVDRGFSPSAGYSEADGIFITPLTDGTGRLTPDLVPTALKGHLPEAPGTTASALYQSVGIGPRFPMPELTGRNPAAN